MALENLLGFLYASVDRALRLNLLIVLARQGCQELEVSPVTLRAPDVPRFESVEFRHIDGM